MSVQTGITSPSTEGALPSREFKLLVDGFKSWVESLSTDADRPPCVGILDGEHGMSCLVDALRGTCSDLGIRFLRSSVCAAEAGPAGGWCELVETILEAAPAATVQRHAAVLRTLIPESDALRDAAALPGLDAEGARLRVMDSMVLACVEAAERTPTVIAFEDVENADPFSRDVLRHLLRVLALRARRRNGHRLLVVLSGRTCDADGDAEAMPLGFHELRGSGLVAFRVDVRGLSRDDTRQLAQARLGRELPLTLREKVHRACQGDARAIDWALRRIARVGESEALWIDRCSDIGELVPDEYRALDPDRRRLVLQLAVIGTPASSEFLERLEPGAASDEVLAGLERDGWAASFRGFSSAETVRFGIDPDVARAVLGCESQDVIAEIHGRVAAVLLEDCERSEAVAGRTAVRVASHIFATLGSGRVAKRARRRTETWGTRDAAACLFDVSRAAAGWLESLGCQREALDVLERALVCGTSDDGGRHDVETRVARLLEATGNHREAIAFWRGSLSATEDPEATARAWRKIGDLRGELGESGAQIDAYLHGLRAVEGSAVLERTKLLAQLARVHHESGEHEDSESYLRQGLDLLQSQDFDLDDECLEMYRVTQEVRFDCYDASRAIELEKRLLDERDARGDIVGRLVSLRSLARLFARTGEVDAAEACLRAGLDAAERSSARHLVAGVLAELGVLFGDRGGYADAFRFLERAWALFHELGREVDVGGIESRLCEYELRTGRFSDAARTLRRLLERRFGLAAGPTAVAPRIKTTPGVEFSVADGAAPAGLGPTATLDWVEQRAAQGDVSGAFRHLENALGREDFRGGVVRARAVGLLGRLAFLRGDVELAIKSYEQGFKCLAASADRSGLETAYLEVGAIFLDRGHYQRALEYTLRGLRLALDAPDERTVLVALSRLAEFLNEIGDFQAAGTIARSAATLARAAGLASAELDACVLLARAASQSGDAAEATGAFRRAAELDARLDLPLVRCRLLLEKGWHDLRTCRFGTALDGAQHGLELARDLGLTRSVEDFRHLVGAVEADPRNPRKNFLHALDVLAETLETAERDRRPHRAWELLDLMAAIYDRRAKVEVAAGFRQRAEVLRTIHAEPRPAAWGEWSWPCRHDRRGFSQDSADRAAP